MGCSVCLGSGCGSCCEIKLLARAWTYSKGIWDELKDLTHANDRHTKVLHLRNVVVLRRWPIHMAAHLPDLKVGRSGKTSEIKGGRLAGKEERVADLWTG